MLKECDSPIDLMLRGFSRDEVLVRTGVDIGYHGAALRRAAAEIDRFVYKVEHVKERVPSEDVQKSLEAYALGASKTEVLSALGLAGENVVKLKELFAALDRSEDFLDADRRYRQGNMSRGMTNRYGVDNPFKLDVMQDKARQTRVDRYGAEYTLASGSSLEKRARQTFLENMKNDSFREALNAKRRKTNIQRFGVDHVMKDPATIERIQKGFREKYGVDSWAQTPQARLLYSDNARKNAKQIFEKSRETCMERYGVSYWGQTPQAREMQSRRMRSVEVQRSATAARRAHRTFHVSRPEDDLWDLLVEHFGLDDVVRQYRDEERYPWACDFYVPSRDLFIELNGLWTHGGHWFDPHDARDVDRRVAWESKGTAFYDTAVMQWCTRDVSKRRMAAEKALNYVVFWGDNMLDDARLWIAMGAPDGQDWQREYSWLPQRELNLDMQYRDLDESPRSAISIARTANWREFYKRELEMWRDGYSKNHGSVAGRIFSNRYRYLHKLPDELSDFEILRGMSIAGMLRAYTVFDNTAMRTVLDLHHPQHIYDPCAGWGERLVTAAARSVRYTGIDINARVVNGHQRIIDQYQLVDQVSYVGDAAHVDMRGADHDMVFTCPPYGSIEKYTSAGAENLGDSEFISWWRDVVRMSTSRATQVFAYQINNRWKAEMNGVLRDEGWVPHSDHPRIPVKKLASHFQRSRGGKVRKGAYEEVQVFVRA